MKIGEEVAGLENKSLPVNKPSAVPVKKQKNLECVSRTEQLWWSAKTRNEGRKRNKEQFK